MNRGVRILPNIGERDEEPNPQPPLSRQEQRVQHWAEHQVAVAAERTGSTAIIVSLVLLHRSNTAISHRRTAVVSLTCMQLFSN